MTTRTDILRVRLETDDNGKVKASILGVADAADKVNKATASSAEGAGKATQALKETSHAADDLTESFHGNSRAITSLQDLIDDLVSGQFGRAKRELSALANETGFLSKLMSPLGAGLGLAAAAVGVLVAGFIEGERQTQAWTDAIAASGNAIGATNDQLESMTQTLGAQNGNYSGARDAILELAKDGKLTASSFATIGQAALDMSRLTDQSAGDAAKQLADLADQPGKAAMQFHLLTVAQYDQIEALEKQGRTVEAEAIAERAYAQTLRQRAQDVEDSAGTMERAGHAIKSAWDDAWNAIEGIGRSDLGTRLSAAEAQLKAVRGRESEYLPGEAHGLEYQQLEAQARAAQALIDQIHGQMAAAGVKRFFDQDAAQASAQAVAAQQALKQFETPDQKLQDELELSAQRKLAALYGVVDPAKRAEIEAEFQREVHDAHQQYEAAIRKDNRATPGQTALAGLDQYVNHLNASSLVVLDSGPLTKYTDGIAKLLDEYDKAVAKGADVTQATADYDRGVQALTRDLDAQQKQLHDRNEAALKSYTNAMDKQNEALQNSYALQVARIGLGEKEYAQLEAINRAYATEADELRNVAQKQLEYASTKGQSGLDPQHAQAMTDQIRASTAQQVAIIQNGYAQMDAASADWHNGAIKAMQDWADQGANVAGQTAQVFTDAFSGMNDALVNFVTTGKLNFGDLVKSILADLARMELRIIESKILQSILGYFTGAYGQADTVASDYSSVVGGGVAYANGGAFGYSGEIAAFANGGTFTNNIVSKPTLFAFANGGALGVMGEAGPEAVMPLTRTPDGKLGVRAAGGGGGDIYQFNNNVTISDSGTTSQTSGDDRRRAAKQLNDQMKAAALDVLNRARQPGGVLWKDRQGQGI